jgi:hypothetical protein
MKKLNIFIGIGIGIIITSSWAIFSNEVSQSTPKVDKKELKTGDEMEFKFENSPF